MFKKLYRLLVPNSEKEAIDEMVIKITCDTTDAIENIKKFQLSVEEATEAINKFEIVSDKNALLLNDVDVDSSDTGNRYNGEF